MIEAKNYSDNPRFCPKCISETTDESSGNLVSTNYFIGDRFHMESARRCSTCGSVVVRKSGTFFKQKNEYRVIWLNQEQTKFYSRRLKK